MDGSGARQAPSRGSNRQKPCRDLPDSEVLFVSRPEVTEGKDFRRVFPGWFVSAAVEVCIMFGLQQRLHNFFQYAQNRKHDLRVTLISLHSD